MESWHPYRIKTLREAMLLTLEEMAEQVGVTQRTVWRWEHNQAKPRARHCRKMAALEQEALSAKAIQGVTL